MQSSVSHPCPDTDAGRVHANISLRGAG